MRILGYMNVDRTSAAGPRARSGERAGRCACADTEARGRGRTRVIVLLAAVLALGSADATTVRAAASAATLTRNQQHRHRAPRYDDLAGRRTHKPAVRRSHRSGAPHLDARAAIASGGRDDLERHGFELGDLLVTRVALGASRPQPAPWSHPSWAITCRGRARPHLWIHPRGRARGAGFGFAVTGDIAALSWRAAFVLLALPAFALAWLIFRLPSPARGGIDHCRHHRAGRAVDLGRNPSRRPTHRGLPVSTGSSPTPSSCSQKIRGGCSAAATRSVLRVRTNLVLIVASAEGTTSCGGFRRSAFRVRHE